MSLLFGYQNAVDASALSSSSETSSMPSTNLASPVLQRVWRSLVTTSDFVSLFASAIPINFLALAGATLGSADTVRHRLYDNSLSLLLDTGAIASGVISPYNIHFYKLTNPLTVKKWQCDIVATSRASQGYFDIGRAWAGPSFEPAVGMSAGWKNGWLDDAVPGRGRYSGVTFASGGAQRRAAEFTLSFMTDAERQSAQDMISYCGVRNQVVFVPFTDGDWARQAVLGKFTSQDLVAEPQYLSPATFSQQFRIEQDL